MKSAEHYQQSQKNIWSILPPDEGDSPEAQDAVVNFISKLVTKKEFSYFEENPGAARLVLESLRDAEHKSVE